MKKHIFILIKMENFEEKFLLKKEPVFINRREFFIIEKECDILKKTIYYGNFGRSLEFINELKLKFNSLKKTILNYILCYVFYFKNGNEISAYNRKFNTRTNEFNYFKISFIDINGEIRDSVVLDENFETNYFHLSRLIHLGCGIGFKETKNPIELDYEYFKSDLEWWKTNFVENIVSEDIQEKVLNASILNPSNIISLMKSVNLSKIDKVFLIDFRQDPPFWAEGSSGYDTSLFLLESDLFQNSPLLKRVIFYAF